jgi:hypothetical protein
VAVEAIGVLVVLAVIAGLIALVVYAAKKERERREALQQMALELGLSFDPAPRKGDGPYHGFSPFHQGHSRRAMNTMEGAIECLGRPFPTICGDYEYKVTSSNGKTTTTTTYHFSYLILRIALRQVPDLSIRPEGFFDKIAGAMGFDDIDFESAEFSRKFHVKSPDKRFAYDVVDPRMMEFLLANAKRQVQIVGGSFLLWEGTRRWAPEEFRERIAFARAFFDRWPEHVVKEHS